MFSHLCGDDADLKTQPLIEMPGILGSQDVSGSSASKGALQLRLSADWLPVASRRFKERVGGCAAG